MDVDYDEESLNEIVPLTRRRKTGNMKLNGLVSPSHGQSESSADVLLDYTDDPVQEQPPTPQFPTKVRKIARQRSIAPSPEEEADPKYPSKVDTSTGKHRTSINESRRLNRLTTACKKYVGMLQQASMRSETGLLPDNTAAEYIPRCFNDLQQGFRVKISQLEKQLGFLYSDTSAAVQDGSSVSSPASQKTMSIWTKWAWSSFWVKVKLDLDQEGNFGPYF